MRTRSVSKLFYIGERFVLDGSVYVVQDRDLLLEEVYIGVVDVNGIVWDPRWISVDVLRAKIAFNQLKQDIKP